MDVTKIAELCSLVGVDAKESESALLATDGDISQAIEHIFANSSLRKPPATVDQARSYHTGSKRSGNVCDCIDDQTANVGSHDCENGPQSTLGERKISTTSSKMVPAKRMQSKSSPRKRKLLTQQKTIDAFYHSPSRKKSMQESKMPVNRNEQPGASTSRPVELANHSYSFHDSDASEINTNGDSPFMSTEFADPFITEHDPRSPTESEQRRSLPTPLGHSLDATDLDPSAPRVSWPAGSSKGGLTAETASELSTPFSFVAEVMESLCSTRSRLKKSRILRNAVAIVLRRFANEKNNHELAIRAGKGGSGLAVSQAQVLDRAAASTVAALAVAITGNTSGPATGVGWAVLGTCLSERLGVSKQELRDACWRTGDPGDGAALLLTGDSPSTVQGDIKKRSTGALPSGTRTPGKTRGGAAISRSRQSFLPTRAPPTLMVGQLLQEINKLGEVEGAGSVQRRVAIVRRLLRGCRTGPEMRHMVRLLCRNVRTGCSEDTIVREFAVAVVEEEMLGKTRKISKTLLSELAIDTEEENDSGSTELLPWNTRVADGDAGAMSATAELRRIFERVRELARVSRRLRPQYLLSLIEGMVCEAQVGRRLARETVERLDEHRVRDIAVRSSCLEFLERTVKAGCVFNCPALPMLGRAIQSYREAAEHFLKCRNLLAECKYDGVRAQAHVTSHSITLYSRDALEQTDRFRDVCEGLRQSCASFLSGSLSQSASTVGGERGRSHLQRKRYHETEKQDCRTGTTSTSCIENSLLGTTDIDFPLFDARAGMEPLNVRLPLGLGERDSEPCLIIDGEIIAVDKETGRPASFQKLMSRPKKWPENESIQQLTPVSFVCFDLLRVGGENLLNEPLKERRRRLHEYVKPPNSIVQFAFSTEIAVSDLIESSEVLDEGEQEDPSVHKVCLAEAPLQNIVPALGKVAGEGVISEVLPPVDFPEKAGLEVAPPSVRLANIFHNLTMQAGDDYHRCEGLMVKDMDSAYEPGERGEMWAKIKRDYVSNSAATAEAPGVQASKPSADSYDLVAVGGWRGNGRKKDFLSPILLCIYDEDDGSFQSLCRCMSGFSDKFYKEITERYIGSGGFENITVEDLGDSDSNETLDSEDDGDDSTSGSEAQNQDGGGPSDDSKQTIVAEDSVLQGRSSENNVLKATSEKGPQLFRSQPANVITDDPCRYWFKPPYPVWEIRGADLSISPVHKAGFTHIAEAEGEGRGLGLRFPRFIRKREDKAATDAETAREVVAKFYKQHRL